MDELVKQKVQKAIRDNGAVPVGIINTAVREIALFRYRGIDMEMSVDQVSYKTVKSHIKDRVDHYVFPLCKCGRTLPAGCKPGIICVMCVIFGAMATGEDKK